MRTFDERLTEHVQVTGFCWLWTGAQTKKKGENGYGQVWSEGRNVVAHKWVYESLVGLVPDGLDLDHLCRIRLCVNPDHVVPATRKVNLRRGLHSLQGVTTRCRRGHDTSQPEHQHVVQRGPKAGRIECGSCLRHRNARRFKKEAL